MLIARGRQLLFARRGAAHLHGRLTPLAPWILLLSLAATACVGAPATDEVLWPRDASTAPAADGADRIDVGGPASEVSATADHVWVRVGSPVDAIVQVEAETGEVRSAILGGSAVEAGAEGLWVAHPDRLLKLDPATGAELIHVDRGGALALGDGSAWLYERDGTLTRVDAASGDVQQIAAIDPALCTEPQDLLIDSGSAWLSCEHGAIVRIDVADGSVGVLPTVGGRHTFAATADHVWVTDQEAGRVMRIDPGTSEVTEIGGLEPGAIAVGGGFVWATDQTGIAKIDPGSGEVIDHVDLSVDRIRELAWDDGVLWAATPTEGVLRLAAP